jgi:hypothetical protein
MRFLILILGVTLSACAAQQSSDLAPLVTRVTHADRLFHVTWDMQRVSATLIDRDASPTRRVLIGLGVSVIERTTKCEVIDARLAPGVLTIEAEVDCTARTVLSI